MEMIKPSYAIQETKNPSANSLFAQTLTVGNTRNLKYHMQQHHSRESERNECSWHLLASAYSVLLLWNGMEKEDYGFGEKRKSRRCRQG